MTSSYLTIDSIDIHTRPLYEWYSSQSELWSSMADRWNKPHTLWFHFITCQQSRVQNRSCLSVYVGVLSVCLSVSVMWHHGIQSSKMDYNKGSDAGRRFHLRTIKAIITKSRIATIWLQDPQVRAKHWQDLFTAWDTRSIIITSVFCAIH